MQSLQDVYIAQLQDLYSSNRQTLDLLPQLDEKSSTDALHDALRKSKSSIETQNERLAHLVKKHNADPDGEHCEGTAGLVREAREDVGEAKEGPVRDAVIIASFQRIAHYAIAGYGTCKALAGRLGHKDDVEALKTAVEQAEEGDELFTEIAESDVHPASS